MGVGVGTDNAFYPDVMPLGMSNASACVCHVKRRDMVVANYEFHNRAAEGVVCLDADIVIFAGFGFAPFLPPKFEAFLVPKGTLVKAVPGRSGKRSSDRAAAGAHVCHRFCSRQAGG